MKPATLKSITSPPLVTDGVGCNIRRIIQRPGPTDMDPLLLFDYFSAKAPAGFYDHPHRGFQMATYMVKGTLVHEDFQGNKTKLGPGDYSWANIGRGVVHSEIPESSSEEAVGFMLWANLPKEDKFSKYTYSKFQRDEIPVLDCEGVRVKVLAGEAYNLKGAVKPKNELLILDVEMQDECIFEHIIPRGWNSLCFVYEGGISIGAGSPRANKVSVQKDHAATLEVNREDRLLHIETRQKGARFLLVGGKPLNEPVHQHGPFVLATQQELRQAFEDYSQGVNGFEGAKEFRSELGGRRLNKPNKSGAVS